MDASAARNALLTSSNLVINELKLSPKGIHKWFYLLDSLENRDSFGPSKTLEVWGIHLAKQMPKFNGRGETLKNVVKWMLGDELFGMIDYYRFPERADAWGGPFNGQEVRKSIFYDIVENAGLKAIVETGSYVGTTTEHFARTNLPTFSIEGNKRYYGYAKARLRKFKNIKLYFGDSREKLSLLLRRELAGIVRESLFFYLDAHWNEDLPLREEIEIIFTACSSAIVMVDDFKVPEDAGYNYDDYGVGKSLELDYLSDAIDRCQLAVFFPVKPSDQETGKKRGCVVVCKGGSEQDEILSAINSLRRYGLN